MSNTITNTHKNNSLYIGKAVFEIIGDILPVYPIIADHGTEYPFAVYRRSSLAVGNTKDIYNVYEHPVLEIAIASTDYDESIELANKVKSRLEHHRYSNFGVHIMDCSLLDASENWNNDAYIQILTFKFQIVTK